jgi:hypothetical protein
MLSRSKCKKLAKLHRFGGFAIVDFLLCALMQVASCLEGHE